jgi:hypothetical protein
MAPTNQKVAAADLAEEFGRGWEQADDAHA